MKNYTEVLLIMSQKLYWWSYLDQEKKKVWICSMSTCSKFLAYLLTSSIIFFLSGTHHTDCHVLVQLGRGKPLCIFDEYDFKCCGCHKPFTENHTAGRGEEMTEKYYKVIKCKFMSHTLLAERNIKNKIMFLSLTEWEHDQKYWIFCSDL